MRGGQCNFTSCQAALGNLFNLLIFFPYKNVTCGWDRCKKKKKSVVFRNICIILIYKVFYQPSQTFPYNSKSSLSSLKKDIWKVKYWIMSQANLYGMWCGGISLETLEFYSVSNCSQAWLATITLSTIPYLRVLRGLRKKIGIYTHGFIDCSFHYYFHSFIKEQGTSYWMTEYTDYHIIIF